MFICLPRPLADGGCGGNAIFALAMLVETYELATWPAFDTERMFGLFAP